MGKLQFYSSYLNNVAKSPNENWREQKQAFVDEMFENSTTVRDDILEEGYPFDFKFVNNPKCWVSTVIDVTTGMVKNSDDYRSLYFKDITHEAGRGRYFKWANNYWLVYETTTSELETISTCNIRRCNNWLKWLTNKGEVIKYPCVIEGDLTSANAQVAKTITQANGHINLIVQGNKDTLSLIRNQRILINHIPYKFYAINNYMQTDYVDENAPLLFMNFYLDMEIDEDNVEENLADDLRKEYRVECNVSQITGHSTDVGYITSKAYRNNTLINPRIEYISSDDTIVSIDNNGYYILKRNGEATITVRILGNELTEVEIPVTVTNEENLTYNIVISPIIESLRQGLSVVLSAEIFDNFTNKIDAVVSLEDSGTDRKNNYTIVDNHNNTWTLTNKLKSKEPLVLTFSNNTYGVSKTIKIQLKAMF